MYIDVKTKLEKCLGLTSERDLLPAAAPVSKSHTTACVVCHIPVLYLNSSNIKQEYYNLDLILNISTFEHHHWRITNKNYSPGDIFEVVKDKMYGYYIYIHTVQENKIHNISIEKVA